jgi:hypothetical protein
MNIPIERLEEYRWQIPAEIKFGMTVPAIIHADERLLEQFRHDLSLEQAANTGESKRSGGTIDLHDGAAPAVRALGGTRARGSFDSFPIFSQVKIGSSLRDIGQAGKA